jgi:predicted nucleotidyltransferase
MKAKNMQKLGYIEPILSSFKHDIEKLYGNRLTKLILFGSYARGTARLDSDVDLLIVLKHIESPFEEIKYLSDLSYEYELNHVLFFNTVPTSNQLFEQSDLPFYQNVRREGVVL